MLLTLFALVLHLNCTALDQSESSNFFMYIINSVIELSLREISYVLYVRALMTRKSCAVGMRNAILSNHLKHENVGFVKAVF